MTNPPLGPWGRPPQVPPTERIPSQVPPPEATQRISRQAPPEPPTQQFQTANASPLIAPEEPRPPAQSPLRRLVSDPLSIVLVLVTVAALGLVAVSGLIVAEASLSFLGLGIAQPDPTWGNMIASSRLYLQIAPWTIFAPGICLALVVLAVNLLGDGLRDRLDPRISRRM